MFAALCGGVASKSEMVASEWVIDLTDILTAGNYTCTATIVPPAPPQNWHTLHTRTHTLSILHTHITHHTNS